MSAQLAVQQWLERSTWERMGETDRLGKKSLDREEQNRWFVKFSPTRAALCHTSLAQLLIDQPVEVNTRPHKSHTHTLLSEGASAHAQNLTPVANSP